MINYGLFIVLIGLIIFKGVSTHPASRKNDTRKDSMNHQHPRNMERRSMYYDKRQSGYKTDSSKGNSLESVVLAIDTGVKNFMAIKNKPDIVDSIARTLVDFAKKTASNPVYRSTGQEYDIRPELIRFKDEKPSVLVAINSESIINGLKNLLRSKTVHKLMDKLTKEAAVVYRSIKYELEGKNERVKQQ